MKVAVALILRRKFNDTLLLITCPVMFHEVHAGRMIATGLLTYDRASVLRRLRHLYQGVDLCTCSHDKTSELFHLYVRGQISRLSCYFVLNVMLGYLSRILGSNKSLQSPTYVL